MEKRHRPLETDEIARLRGEVGALRLQMRDKDRMVETLSMRVESLTDEVRELRREALEGFRELLARNEELQDGLQEAMGTLATVVDLIKR